MPMQLTDLFSVSLIVATPIPLGQKLSSPHSRVDAFESAECMIKNKLSINFFIVTFVRAKLMPDNMSRIPLKTVG